MREQSSQLQLKNFNRRMVLNYIRRKECATKAELSTVTGLTFMAIKKILEELEHLNLIRSDHMQEGGVGRRAVAYTINERFGYTIGVHINSSMLNVAVLNLKGEIIAGRSCDMNRIPDTQSEFLDMTVGMIREAVTESGIEEERILGVGVGAPGPVDSENGVIITPPNFPVLHYLPIKEILEQQLGYPVMVNKDTNVVCNGEYWRGAGRGYSDVVYVDVDMGIGSGIVVDGRVIHGTNNVAGEFGHMTMDIEGPLCNCGNRGCVEAICSGIAILKEVRRELEGKPDHPLYEKRRGLVIQEVLEAAAVNDLLCISVLNKSASYVGVALANLIHILDPQIIILGGILVWHYPRYLDIARDNAYARGGKGRRSNTLITSVLKEKAGVVGAGEFVADHFFDQVVNEILTKN